MDRLCLFVSFQSMKFSEIHAFYAHNNEFIPKGSSFGSHILFKGTHPRPLLSQPSVKKLTQLPSCLGAANQLEISGSICCYKAQSRQNCHHEGQSFYEYTHSPVTFTQHSRDRGAVWAWGEGRGRVINIGTAWVIPYLQTPYLWEGPKHFPPTTWDPPATRPWLSPARPGLLCFSHSSLPFSGCKSQIGPDPKILQAHTRPGTCINR